MEAKKSMYDFSSSLRKDKIWNASSSSDEIPDFLKEHTDWINSRKLVDGNPNNVNNWNQLIKSSEKLLLVKPLTDDLKQLIRETFDELLTRFPLFFGYWKKFVSAEFQLSGLSASISTLARSVESFSSSLELWVDYLSILITNHDLQNADDVQKIRDTFERGLQNVGHQFLSHPLWNKFISFEKNLSGQNQYEKNVRLYNIYSRVVKIPLHQYSKYMIEFLELKKMFSIDQLIEIDHNLKESQTVSKMDAKDQTFVDEYFHKIFTETSQAVSVRWKYESKFKPAYFNLTELSKDSLVNFEQYLNFEEKQGDHEQIKSLYERVLIPAACYEKFWIKYVKWLVFIKEKDEIINNVYLRAMNSFLTLDKVFLRISYLYFVEKMNMNETSTDENKEEAFENVNSVYMLFLRVYKDFDSNIQCQLFLRYLQFLQRFHGIKEYLSLMETVIGHLIKSSSVKELSTLPAHFVKIYHNANDALSSIIINSYLQLLIIKKQIKNVGKTRDFFNLLSHQINLKSSEQFWLQFYNFERIYGNYITLRDLINTNFKVNSYLPPIFIKNLVKTYIEFLEINSANLIENTKNITVEDIYKDIAYQRADIESSLIFQHSHKLRLSTVDNKSLPTAEELTNKYLINSNGNIGFESDERPLIINQVPIYESLEKIPNLPTFKNVEKANTKPIPLNFQED